MKIVKLLFIIIITTIVMAISWAIGSMIGNIVTQSTPPPPPEGNGGLIFMAVCGFCSLLVTLLVAQTSTYTGARRNWALMGYGFGIQFFLMQLETYFFAADMGIGHDQVTAILIAGVIESFATFTIAIALYKKLFGAGTRQVVLPSLSATTLRNCLILVLLIYPLLYMTFGYFIAWQNERLRIYYTSSSEMAPYFHQLAKSIGNGIYFFQIFRATLWIAITLPVAVMLSDRKPVRMVLIGLFSALLPTVLLFIPNPYMPYDIAMSHFVETSTSNFLWGLAIGWVTPIATSSIPN